MRGHVRARGNKWCVVVDVGRDETGRRMQRWHSGYARRKDAEAALPEILSRLQNGTYIQPSKQSVGHFLAEWLEAMQSSVRPSTWRSYEMNIRTHVTPALGSALLQNITASALNALYGKLSQTGRCAGGGGLSPRTVRLIHTIIRKALSDAVRWNRLPRNVADQAEPPRQRQNRQITTWAPEELRAFLRHAESDRLYGAWFLAATTGLRRGEVLGLHWRDLDLDAGRLAVTTTLLAVRNELLWSEPKTAKGRRSVALDALTVAALREHRKRQIEERLQWGAAYQNLDLVFGREDGSPVHPDQFSGRFDVLVKGSAVQRIRLHDLRHTHATLALAANVHPKVVSERLGHATISITLDTYSHAIPALQEEAAEKIARVVFG